MSIDTYPRPQLQAAVVTALREFASFPVLQKHLAHIRYSSQVHLLAIGKSAYPMAKAAVEELTTRNLPCEGYLLTKYGHAPSALPGITMLEAGHPVPDANSFRHTAGILSWLETLPATDDLIILLSGGGSSLFELPARGHSPEEICALNQRLLLGGQDITAMNFERSKLSAVKSGKALAHIPCRRISVFALSDVYGNNPQVIASGPFTPADPADQRVSYEIIGDNLALLQTLVPHLPVPCHLHPDYIHVSAAEAAGFLSGFALLTPTPGIHLWGGEAPVQVTQPGKGGRCTHLALDFALRIAGNRHLSLLTYASDGNDNVEGVAGAWVDGGTCDRMRTRGIDPESSLRNCDSLPALQAVGAIIPSIEARINVNDIYLLGIS